MRNQETLGTIWDVTEEFWERIEPIILEKDPPKTRGRTRLQYGPGINPLSRRGCNQNHRQLGDNS